MIFQVGSIWERCTAPMKGSRRFFFYGECREKMQPAERESMEPQIRQGPDLSPE